MAGMRERSCLGCFQSHWHDGALPSDSRSFDAMSNPGSPEKHDIIHKVFLKNHSR